MRREFDEYYFHYFITTITSYHNLEAVTVPRCKVTEVKKKLTPIMLLLLVCHSAVADRGSEKLMHCCKEGIPSSGLGVASTASPGD